MKRSYVLAMSVALSLIVTGCSDSEPKSDRDTGSDAEIDGGQSVSELCLDEEYEHYDEERRKEALNAIFYKIHGPGAEPHPHCMREDGLGGDDEYCEDSEVDPVHYFFCVETDEESEEGEGEEIEGRSEPCYWWIRPIMASEMCCKRSVG